LLVSVNILQASRLGSVADDHFSKKLELTVVSDPRPDWVCRKIEDVAVLVGVIDGLSGRLVCGLIAWRADPHDTLVDVRRGRNGRTAGQFSQSDET
jgi:hypothetical protein